MKMRWHGLILFFTAILAAPARPALAADPFTLTAAGGSNTIKASGNNLVDIAGNLIDRKDQYAALAGTSFNGNLRYGGLNNAVLFSENAAGTSASITIPSTGFSKTFNAANQHDLRNQIEDFFKKNGAQAYADFLDQINRQTTIGVSDGNPLATTALMADASFNRFGFQAPRFDIGEGPRLGGFEIDAAGGMADTDDGDGYYASLGVGNTFRLADRIGLSLNLDFRYRDIEGAAVYQIVNTDALPILLIAPDNRDHGLSWTLTPAFVIGFGGSWDLAAGGVPIGGQITSSLAYRAGGWTFVLANQYGYYGGLPIDLSDFRFETSVDQQIVKNGVQVIRTFGSAFVDAGVSYTNLLNDARIDGYLTPSVGVGFRFGSASGIRVGYHGDFADGFTTNGGDVELFINF
jgi:hypothetical protein